MSLEGRWYGVIDLILPRNRLRKRLGVHAGVNVGGSSEIDVGKVLDPDGFGQILEVWICRNDFRVSQPSGS